MMLIVPTEIFAVGKYSVQQRPRQDSPGWAVYLVFSSCGKLIGRSFSRPDEDCCRWLERQHDSDTTRYAEHSAQLKTYTFALSKRGRPSNAERARRMQMLLAGLGK